MGTIKTHIDSTVSMSLSLLLFWFFILCETFQSTMSFYPYFSILLKFCFLYFGQEGKCIVNFMKEQKI